MTGPKIPEWVTSLSLNDAVHTILGNGCKVLAVLPNVDDIQFRNCTILLPIKVRVQSKDQTMRKLFFILKAQNNSKFQAKIMKQLKMFFREYQMYHNILPKFEQLYQAVGKSTVFGPRAFRLDHNIGVQYILLEDLKTRGFRNVKRNVGFDELCLKQILKKLAEFHAASVLYVKKFGMFSKLMTMGVYTRANKLILQELNDADPFLSQLRRWRVGGKFHQRLIEKEGTLIDRMLDMHKARNTEFNVLNHSDCWVNNVMFKYDGIGSLEDTALLDYQVVKFGSPATDLFYTILSSAQMDIKLSKFDYFVQYYFYYLLENLKYLDYQQPLPELKDIQNALNANGLSAYVVVTRVLPIVMMDQFEDEVHDSYASKMKCLMFTNRKFIQAINEILPWMDSRGLLNWHSYQDI